MADLTWGDMEISVRKFGEHDFTIKLRTLKVVYTPAQMAALLYPIFDSMEKAQAGAQPAQPAQPPQEGEV